MPKKLIYWILALALIPLLWAVIHAVVTMVPRVGEDGIRTWWLYAFGGIVYLLLEKIFHRPMTLYVFGHELTHALSGLLSGAKIHSFKVGAKGGEVRLSKSNPFVTLSPYVVPIYSLFVLAIYAVTRVWWDKPALTYAFQFTLGATLAFHMSMTAAAIHRKQPDLKLMGMFLSGVLIAIGNSVLLGLFCVSFFRKTPTLKDYSVHVGRETVHAWKVTVDTAKTRVEKMRASSGKPKPRLAGL